MNSRRRTREDFGRLSGLVDMKRRLMITALALGVLLLALGGWLVQCARVMPRLLVASAS
jgi:hypothetical protein